MIISFFNHLVAAANCRSAPRAFSKTALKRMFSFYIGKLRMIMLPQAAEANEEEWTGIRQSLFQKTRIGHNERSKAGVAFSAKHFITLFKFACDQFCMNKDSPLNFIRASWYPNPMPKDISTHIADFFWKRSVTR